MKKVKISIVYHSESQNTKMIGEDIEKGILEMNYAETKLMSIKEVDYDYLMESNCIIFGTPTYLSSMSWQMKQWLDNSVKYNFSGKLAGVFATEKHIGGGADIALLTLINHLMVKGMLIYSGGSSLGDPYIHLGPVAIQSGDEYQRKRAFIFGKRMAEKTYELFEK